MYLKERNNKYSIEDTKAYIDKVSSELHTQHYNLATSASELLYENKKERLPTNTY